MKYLVYNNHPNNLFGVGIALQILVSTSLLAQPGLDDLDMEEHVRHYNSLPAVEESDAELQKASQFTPFLKEAEEIVTRYELESFVGLRLIHRHFFLNPYQIMAEEYKVVQQPSLVTSAHSLEDAKEIKATPASWIFSTQREEDVLLFETSSDSAVKSGNMLLDKSPEFFVEMGDLIRDHNLTDLLSVAILKRDSLIASKEQVYLEVNSADLSRSVVQLWDANKTVKGVIRTSWSFKGPRQQGCWAYHYCIQRPKEKEATWESILTIRFRNRVGGGYIKLYLHQ